MNNQPEVCDAPDEPKARISLARACLALRTRPAPSTPTGNRPGSRRKEPEPKSSLRLLRKPQICLLSFGLPLGSVPPFDVDPVRPSRPKRCRRANIPPGKPTLLLSCQTDRYAIH